MSWRESEVDYERVRSLALALVILAVLGVVPLDTAYALQQEGSIARAQDDAEVMDTIPVGLLANSRVVDVVARGDRVVVLEMKNIPTSVMLSPFAAQG